MALGKAMGPGGRIARAEKKVDKAKEKVSKVAKNLISSRDTPSEYDRKRAIQGNTEAKVSKAVAKVDKAKGKLTTATRKVAEKAEAKYDKAKAKNSEAISKYTAKFADKAFKAMKSDKAQIKAAKNYLKSKMK